MPAQRQDAAAGAADVAQQQLQDRRGADVLHADRVLGPADGVDERAGALAARSCAPAPRTPRRNCSCGTPQVSLHHLGGVAGEVPLEHLEDAARVLQRLVALAACSPLLAARRPCALVLPASRSARARRSLALVAPPGRRGLAAPRTATRVVGAGLGVEAGEQPVEVLGVPEVLAQDRRARWCRRTTYSRNARPFSSTWLIDAAEERDVAAGAQRDVHVGHRARAGEPRVDVDHLRAARLGLHHPLEAHRVASAMLEPWMTMQSALARSCWKLVAPPRPNEVPRPGTVARVSNARLVLDLHRAHRREELLDEVVLLVVERRAAEAARCPGCGAACAVLVDVLPASRGRRAPGRRSCPSPCRGRASSHSVPCGRRYATLSRAAGAR